MTKKIYYENLYLNFNRLIAYRNLLKDPIIVILKDLLKELSKDDPNKEKLIDEFYNLYHKLIKNAENLSLNGNILKAYIINLIIGDKNFFSLSCEKYGHNIQKDLYLIALNDIKTLSSIMNIDIEHIRNSIDFPYDFLSNYTPTGFKNRTHVFQESESELINSNSEEEFLSNLINHYYTIGSSELSKHIAFKWDNKIVGIEHFDKIDLDDIIGYDYQKNILINNTKAFLNGFLANNVLLIGSSGTGKSSSIRALANHFYSKGLRLLEITKDQLLCLPEIINELSSRGKHFIIFIDDLSFEDFETDYKQLKSILDGGVQQIPKNVLIYSTSNRRHLIKETWNDRMSDEDVHISDCKNEKLSLSERFGITLNFDSPNQEHYFNIVKNMAAKSNLNVDEELLKKESVKWELNTHGRSGRTAKQFITYFAASLEK